MEFSPLPPIVRVVLQSVDWTALPMIKNGVQEFSKRIAPLRAGRIKVRAHDPNTHGWYFAAPTLEDHTVEGRWTDDCMVLDGKNSEGLSLKYMREYSSAIAGEPLSLHVITTLSGSWFLPAGNNR